MKSQDSNICNRNLGLTSIFKNRMLDRDNLFKIYKKIKTLHMEYPVTTHTHKLDPLTDKNENKLSLNLVKMVPKC